MASAEHTHNSASVYFVNAWVDAFFIGAASILYFVLMYFAHIHERTQTAIFWGSTLSWVINWPHFSATSYRLYQSKEHIFYYPLTSFLVPIMVVLGVVFSFCYPQIVAPYFVKLFLIWSPYHFSGQTLGLTLIYARRAGITINKLERICMAGFIYGTYFYQSSWSETGLRSYSFYAIEYPTLGIPLWIPTYVGYVMYAFAAVFVFLMFKKMNDTKKSIPWIFFLPMVSQYIWFVRGTGMPVFQEFIPLFHSLQYILIAWMVELHRRDSKSYRATHSRPALFAVTSAQWGIVNLIGGATLFYVTPWFLSKIGWDLGLATGIILSAIQIHHFFVDGVIWKLKNPTTSSPLASRFSNLFTNVVKRSEAV